VAPQSFIQWANGGPTLVRSAAITFICGGTIFHKSSTKLSIWFFAMYLMTSARHGVAEKEIERQTAVKGTHVHISSKHAWKYVSEFSYRRNMRHSHWSMFNLLVHAFALPRLADD
jgi:hypothetical protein